MLYNWFNISLSKKNIGFTLIEISIVIIILAIISSLVFPSYKKLIGTAKQSEAKTILQSIYTAQSLYFSENNFYAKNIVNLDIQIPADSKYQYTIGARENSYTITATANIDSDTALDQWTINEKKELKNLVNDIYE